MKARVVFSRQVGALRGSADAWVRAAGRLVLWALIAVVLVRGVGAILSAEDHTSGREVAPPGAAFPNGEARAFAVRFASAYLGPARDDTDAVVGFLAGGLSDRAGVSAPRRGPGARVAWAMVAREVSLGGSRALLTVAALLEDGRSRYLTVPVARDRDGGLVVFEAPSFSPPAPRGTAARTETAPLSGPGAGTISDLTDRFLRAYVAGAGESALAYFLAPGVRLALMPDGLEVVSVDGVDAVGPPWSGELRRTVLASVRVRDEATGALYGLAYRVEVVRRDRWYVASVAGGRGA